jgi:hypothetical protein
LIKVAKVNKLLAFVPKAADDNSESLSGGLLSYKCKSHFPDSGMQGTKFYHVSRQVARTKRRL